ncbi:hypothetical protein NLJ89_g6205 [Agrocybe chaxingu]|uniref:Uncharacterized protein n=1 Tax=Agrocybe chaxingu TaxID=84603 RepID=A0A9W8MUV7_9AGAR|nr:hypothetical protein NLJ89_g6205 [Agrocybe chaxingu]
MSSTFTPSTTIDMSKERDWAPALGMLDWDNTSIIFTKRTLLEFLKYTGTTVDTNFQNISKLPRYAKFGKLSSAAPDAVDSSATAEDTTSDPASSPETFRPSRRVRTAPGGPTSDIFGHDVNDDALSQAPAQTSDARLNNPAPAVATSESTQDSEPQGLDFGSSNKPSRRVRENPGGNSSLANFWDVEEPKEFKPTRRVRQGPGGHDSISGLF